MARLPSEMDVVIALGGGAITSPLTRERLRDGSFTVLLDVVAADGLAADRGRGR